MREADAAAKALADALRLLPTAAPDIYRAGAVEHDGDHDGATTMVPGRRSPLPLPASTLCQQTLSATTRKLFCWQAISPSRRRSSKRRSAASAPFVSRFPTHFCGRQALARLHIQRKELQGALDALEPVFAQAGDDPKLLELRATLLLGLARHADAIPLLQKLYIERPKDVQVNLKFARALLQTGKTKSAMQLLYNVLSFEPDNIVAAMVLGTSQLSRGNAREALRLSEILLANNPRSASALNLKGSARLAFEEDLAASPGHVALSHNLANLLSRENPDAAIDALRSALAARPDSLSTLLKMASIYQRTNQPDKAVQSLQKARSIAGSNVTPSVALVALYLQQGNVDAALAILLRSAPGSGGRETGCELPPCRRTGWRRPACSGTQGVTGRRRRRRALPGKRARTGTSRQLGVTIKGCIGPAWVSLWLPI
ncbi:MAG: tetratricopeptide repeat protein [Chromatiales bacterium]|jgi:predicted Zn-dependent protease|nr:tetratricopeptide repeat protein [Chromatiales bacterium]